MNMFPYTTAQAAMLVTYGAEVFIPGGMVRGMVNDMVRTAAVDAYRSTRPVRSAGNSGRTSNRRKVSDGHGCVV